jgi:hypothetical protein
MARKVSLLAVPGLLLLAGLILGEQPPQKPEAKESAPREKPSQLEELLARALKENPDVRVAEAKLREAEAELNRARLQVTQKVVVAHHNTELATQAVFVAEASYVQAQAQLRVAEAVHTRAVKIAEANGLPKAELEAAQVKRDQALANLEATKANLQSAKAELAKAQAELPYLLGKSPPGSQDTVRQEAARALYANDILLAEQHWRLATLDKRSPQGTMAEKIRKALDTPVKVRFDNASLDDVLASFQKLTPGVSFLNTTSPLNSPFTTNRRATRNLSLVGEVPLGAALQAVEDGFGVVFAVRDYGILVADQLPQGVVPLHTFWKEGSAEKPKAAEGSSLRSPPSANVEGVVKAVDTASGLLEISLGSDAGLAKGSTLEVFRLTGEKPKYLGRVRILEVKPASSVGKFLRRPFEEAQAGDRVSSRLAED